MEKALPTIHRINSRIETLARPRAVTIAVGLYLTSVLALTISDAHVAAFASDVTKPDLRFGYDYAELHATLTAFGEEGRSAYRLNLVIDTVMSVLLALATILVVARAAPRWLGFLSMAPVTFMVLDIVENASFGIMLIQFPNIASWLVTVTSPVTMTKLLAFLVTMPTLVVSVGVLIYRSLVRKRSANGDS